MAKKRIRGDQVTFRLLDNGAIQTDSWDAVGSANVESTNAILEDEFLGENSKRYDAIFEGYSFDCEVQMFGKAERVLEQKINAKNARQGADAARRFDIAFTEIYPDGSTLTTVLIDVEFGAIKTSFGSRADYLKMSFEGKCSDQQVTGL